MDGVLYSSRYKNLFPKGIACTPHQWQKEAMVIYCCKDPVLMYVVLTQPIHT